MRSMRTTTRGIVITLLPCAVILLLLTLACPDPVLAQQTFSIDFPKKAGLPNSCMTQEPAGSGGTFLRCRIALPANIPSNLFIRAVFFECRPTDSQACLNTQQCPGNGSVCARHLNPVVPVDFNISRPGPRAIEWWGWTSDTGEATLHFDVTLGP
jgi:hypothetical protein